MARISRLAAVSFAACAAAYTAPRSPAPRLGPQCAERPVGGLEAASDADYETWISGQLRLNRVQDKVVGIEERVVGALRRADAAASLGAIGRDIDVLVATNNGVTDRSSSTLLAGQGAWEELLPLRRLFPTFARFRPSARTGGLVVEREARVLGPLLAFGAAADGSPRDSATLALAPRFWGGMYVRVFGLTLPLPRLAPPRARDLVVMYLATDVLVIVDRRAAQG
ncbi:WSC domain-containing protein [Aureococcus anophagefferens]|nr:WSC domain-containing protein [Aureococcus anophagefferens]